VTPRRAHDEGAVTVELAIGMVSVVALLGLVLALVAAGVAQIRCTDAARAGARAASLGEDDSAVALVVRRTAGDAAQVSVARDAEWVDVTVHVPLLGGALLDGVTASASAGLPVEP
jgi:hypothetical protein